MSTLLVRDVCEYQKYLGIQNPNVRESIREKEAKEDLLKCNPNYLYSSPNTRQLSPADMPYFGPFTCCSEFQTQELCEKQLRLL